MRLRSPYGKTELLLPGGPNGDDLKFRIVVVKWFTSKTHRIKKTWGKAPSPFSPNERPIASDDSLGEGNGGGNNQFSLARGKVIALPWAATAQPANQVQCWLSCWPCYNKGGFLVNGTNHWRRMSLIVSVGSLLLCALTFPVSRHSLTLHCCAELHFEYETVADWSQFCYKPMLNFILICSLQIFFNGGW